MRNKIITEQMEEIMKNNALFNNTEKVVRFNYSAIEEKYAESEDYPLLLNITTTIEDMAEADYDNTMTLELEDIVNDFLDKFLSK
jgi:hypothetical protein